MSTLGPVPVVTHVITQQTVPAQVMQQVSGQGFSTTVPVPVNSAGNSSTSGALQKFLKGEPKALGTVQIMIGVFAFLTGFGIGTNTAFFQIGIAFWGSLIYMISGSLTVSAEKLHPCLVKGSLGMSVVSAITAGLAIIILTMDLETRSYICYTGYGPYSSGYCMSVQSFALLIALLILTLLQFSISISIAAFGCKATCASQPAVMFVISNPCTSAPPQENPALYENF